MGRLGQTEGGEEMEGGPISGRERNRRERGTKREEAHLGRPGDGSPLLLGGDDSFRPQQL